MAESLGHLAPKAAMFLDKSDEERIRYIRSPHWIGYPRANEILERLEVLLEYPKSHRMPNLLIAGESNNGKTMLVTRFCNRHKPDDNPGGEAANVPILYMQAPPVPDESRFYNTILELLFAPYKPNDRPDRKQFQVLELLRAVQLKMLIIDEIHHLIAGPMTKQRGFLNVIKYLGNELKIPIVAVGTADADQAIHSDAQMAKRFEKRALPRWTNGSDYLRLLATMEHTTPLRKPSNLSDNSLADKIYAMSGGYIGDIASLVVAAAVRAIETGREKIDKKVLDDLSWTVPTDRRADLIR
ncbi:MAG: TniB family NTP-binding protein [Chromatiales bacterium]|nr:TniB family NTP-binding protein [Chromatiales bacterium]